MQDYFYTIKDSVTSQLKVKGSVFIASLFHTNDRTEADIVLERVRKENYDATHNCFAYRIDADDFRFSDDGEPSGTAGKPILTIIDKYQLERVIAVVTRFFGGTKLGTGGLIRAYSEAAERAIKQTKIVKQYNYVAIQAEYDFDLINKVHHVVRQNHAKIDENASSTGMIADIMVLPSKVDQLKKSLSASTAGKIKII